MALSTNKKTALTKEDRLKKLAELREYHQPYFERIGEPKARFVGKMLYGFPKPNRVRFFENEIASSNPLYVEWVSRDFTPEDERRLYKYVYNPDYATEYPVEVTDSGYEMYVVPVEAFTLVKDIPLAQTEEPKQSTLELDFDIINPDEDCPVENITLRDLAAIYLKAPVSRKEWLNKIIKDSCQK